MDPQTLWSLALSFLGALGLGAWNKMDNRVSELEQAGAQRNTDIQVLITKVDGLSHSLSNHMNHEEEHMEDMAKDIQDIKLAIAKLDK